MDNFLSLDPKFLPLVYKPDIPLLTAPFHSLLLETHFLLLKMLYTPV